MRLRKLDELMVKRGGSVDPSKFKDEVFELLSIPAFDNGSPEVLAGSDIGSSKKVVEPRDVLLSKIVPHIRRCWVVPERDDRRQIASGEWIQFRGDDFYPDYLRLFLVSDRFHSQFMKTVKGVGGSLLRASPAQVAEIVMPFPPLDDQIRIANLLGKVEGLIAQRKQHLEQLDDLLKSVFLDMFGEPTRNEKGWEKKQIGAFAKVGTGSTPSRQKMAEYYGGSIPWVKTTEVQNGDILRTEEHITEQALRETNCCLYPVGTILLAMYGQGRTRGRVGYLRIDAATNQACAAIPPSIHNQTFIFQQLRFLYDSIRALGRGGNQENLNLSLVRGIELVLPPSDIQDTFATIVEKVEALKTHYQQSLADLEALYCSLSQQAFKGELDLSLVALPAVPIEGESPVAPSVHAPITTPTVKLPETDLLLPALQDRTQLALLLRFWLEAYRTQLGDVAFSLERFIAAAQTRLAERHPDNDFELRASDYEHVKAWVFEALDSGRLRQERNQDYCVIETKETVLGNLIELTVSQT